jgi:hypothetical protein
MLLLGSNIPWRGAKLEQLEELPQLRDDVAVGRRHIVNVEHVFISNARLVLSGNSPTKKSRGH